MLCYAMLCYAMLCYAGCHAAKPRRRGLPYITALHAIHYKGSAHMVGGDELRKPAGMRQHRRGVGSRDKPPVKTAETRRERLAASGERHECARRHWGRWAAARALHSWLRCRERTGALRRACGHGASHWAACARASALRRWQRRQHAQSAWRRRVRMSGALQQVRRRALGRWTEVARRAAARARSQLCATDHAHGASCTRVLGAWATQTAQARGITRAARAMRLGVGAGAVGRQRAGRHHVRPGAAAA